MELHRTSGRHGLGFALAATTMLLWAVLPLALELVLAVLDAPTIIWFRFLASSVVLGVLLAWRGGLPALGSLDGGGRWLLVVATLFLAANYVAYLVGLDLTSASNAQVLIQLAPLLLALGGIWVFGERFTGLQWIGFAVLVSGLALFFADQLRSLVANADRYLLGCLSLAIAAITWAIYGLAQKQLLLRLSSQGIMLCIYVGCTLIFAPLASPLTLNGLDSVAAAALTFCVFNTVVAYGAFSEALAHWEASRVSSVLALTPLGTLAIVSIAMRLAPQWVEAEHVSATTWAGAAIVVVGSMLTALGGRRPTQA